MNESYWTGIEGRFDFQKTYSKMVDYFDSGAIFVEVGAWFGKSACYMATQIAKSKKKIQFDVVDIWKIEGNSPDGVYDARLRQFGGDIYDQFVGHMKNAGVIDFVNPIQLDSVTASKKYLDFSLDFVFIDGNHFYEGIKQDIEAWFPKVKVGGYIGGHDYILLGVIKAVDEFFGKSNVEFPDGSVWMVQKKEKELEK